VYVTTVGRLVAYPAHEGLRAGSLPWLALPARGAALQTNVPGQPVLGCPAVRLLAGAAPTARRVTGGRRG